jgi:TatD DNase family protein
VRLIDSHAHVQAEAFDSDRSEVINAARDAGVERMLVPGWDLPSSLAALAICAEFRLEAGVGIHPHVARDSDRDFPAIADMARDPMVVAVGETGLDYDRGFSSRADQLANLRRHLLVAGELNKPAILHCRSKPGERDAQDDLLREIDAAGRPPALLHSFSGPVDYGERALEFGLAISFSGLAFRKGEEATAAVACIVRSPAAQHATVGLSHGRLARRAARRRSGRARRPTHRQLRHHLRPPALKDAAGDSTDERAGSRPQFIHGRTQVVTGCQEPFSRRPK